MSTSIQNQLRGPGIFGRGEWRDWSCKQRSSPERYHERFLRRFWAKVDKTPGLGPQGSCWEWRGSSVNKTKDSNYGQIGCRVNGKFRPVRAHVASWTLVHGNPSPPKGHHVCHRCNNKPCVNPDHLFTGTPRQNVHHAQLTGLMPMGRKQLPPPVDYRIGRLSRRQYWLIRKSRRKQGVSLVDLAHMAQMDKSHLSMLERGKRPCRVSQLIFILDFLNIDHDEFGLSTCPLSPVRALKNTKTKYLTNPPQYVYRKPAHAQHLRKKAAMWLERMKPRSDFYDAQALIDVIVEKAVLQKDIREATGLQRIDLFTVLQGHEKDSNKVLAMIKYVESLKAEKAA